VLMGASEKQIRRPFITILRKMNSRTIQLAFYKSVPVMAGYIVLGIGFGILMHNAGYGVLWTAAMSIFIYAGSLQYVGVGLLSGGASILTTALLSVAWDDTDTVFAVVTAYYKQLCDYMDFQDQGVVAGRGCGTPDMTRRSRYMKDAYELGRSL